MAWVLGTYGARDATGWTSFSSPSVIVYVSDSTGSDASSDPTNIATPFKTIFKACNWLRLNGGYGTNFWLLLKRGDTFSNQCISEAMFDGLLLNGASNDPGVIGAYDPAYPGVVNPAVPGVRPKINPNPDAYGALVIGGGDGGYNIALIGLEFETGFDTGYSALNWLDTRSLWIVEDCYMAGWSDGIDIRGSGSTPTTGPVYWRRNIINRNIANGLHSAPKNGPWLIEENVLCHNGWDKVPNHFFHQVYLDSLAAMGDQINLATSPTFRGNISADSATDLQIRPGGIFHDNALIHESSGVTFGNPYNDQENRVTDNVTILARAFPGGNLIELFEHMNVYYLDVDYNLGTGVISGNIACNSRDNNGGFGINLTKGTNGYNVTTNIFYNWAPDGLINDVGATPGYAIISIPGVIIENTITDPGTGYVPLSITITGIRAERDTPFNDIVLEVSDTSVLYDGVTPIWLEGLDGGGNISTLNNTLLAARRLDATHIALANTGHITSTSWTSGGTQKAYYPYTACPAQVNVSVADGSAGGANCMPIVGGSTGVVALGHSTESLGGQAFINGGTNYTVGDTTTVSNAGLGGTGSGLLLTVAAVGTNTISGNTLDGSGTNSNNYPDPNRTPGSYLASLGLVAANCTFTGEATNGILTISGISDNLLTIGDCITYSGQTRQDWIARGSNGDYKLWDVTTDAVSTQTVSSRSMSTPQATFTGSITNGVLTISGISGYVYPADGQSEAVTWSGTNSDGEHLGAVRTLTIVDAGTGGTPGTYTNVSISGGSGSGLIATIVVGGGGTVTSATVTSGANGGQSFQIGDNGLSASDAGLPAGWTASVATICPYTYIRYGGNGTYRLASANNTTNKTTVGSTTMSSWSTQQYLDQCLALSVGTWNPDLMANTGFNPYIRAGFGRGARVHPLRLRLWA